MLEAYLEAVMTFKTLPYGLVVKPFFIRAGQYILYNSPRVISFQIKAGGADMVTGAAS
jgi:hypothetical protein